MTSPPSLTLNLRQDSPPLGFSGSRHAVEKKYQRLCEDKEPLRKFKLYTNYSSKIFIYEKTSSLRYEIPQQKISLCFESPAVTDFFIKQKVPERSLQKLSNIFSNVALGLPALENARYLTSISFYDKKFSLLKDHDSCILFDNRSFIEGGEKNVHLSLKVDLKDDKFSEAAVIKSKLIDRETTSRNLILNEVILSEYFTSLKDERKKHIVSPPIEKYIKGQHIWLIANKIEEDFLDLINREINIEKIANLLLHVSLGLSLMHDYNYSHNDIKLENFFIKDDLCILGDLCLSNQCFSPFPSSIFLDPDESHFYEETEDKRPYDIFLFGKELKRLSDVLDLKADLSTNEVNFKRLILSMSAEMTIDEVKDRPKIHFVITNLERFVTAPSPKGEGF